MVWDLYDGVRSGVAFYRGEPHYFECEFDSEAVDYTDVFKLWMMDEDTLKLATEQWQIYRLWERRFHSGELGPDTHPGNRGQNALYDEIDDGIKQYRNSPGHPAVRVVGKFEAIDDQPELPQGCLREIEVTWLPVP